MVLLNEESVHSKGVVVGPSQLGTYVHVDDGVIVGDNSSSTEYTVDFWMNHFANALEELGFTVNDRNPSSELSKVVGYTPEVSPARLHLARDKAVKLYTELMELHRS